MLISPMFKVLEARSKLENSLIPLYVGMLDTELKAQAPTLVGNVSINLASILSLWQHWEELFGLGQMDRRKVIEEVLAPILMEKQIVLHNFMLSDSILILETSYVCSER